MDLFPAWLGRPVDRGVSALCQRSRAWECELCVKRQSQRIARDYRKPSGTESFMEDRIEIEFRAFVDDRGDEFGVIRELSPDDLIVYVKNAGDFVVSFDTIKALDSRKVIFKRDKLDRRLQRAIKDARDTQ